MNVPPVYAKELSKEVGASADGNLLNILAEIDAWDPLETCTLKKFVDDRDEEIVVELIGSHVFIRGLGSPVMRINCRHLFLSWRFPGINDTARRSYCIHGGGWESFSANYRNCHPVSQNCTNPGPAEKDSRPNTVRHDSCGDFFGQRDEGFCLRISGVAGL